MNKRDLKKLHRCSIRAQKLMERLQAGEYYMRYAPDTPKAMQELIDAGLVGVMGRSPIVVACFVPKGSKPAKPEVIAQ